MFLNDIEAMYVTSGLDGIEVVMFKIFLILYADDIVIFDNSADVLQTSLNLLDNYCSGWRLEINTNTTKVMVYKNGWSVS